MISFEKKAGCLIGAAIGDALGAQVEFMQVPAILQRFPPNGPQEPASRVTDDTQMMLAVGEALCKCKGQFTPARVEKFLRRAFVTWLRDPENNRAPGMTCMSACRQLAAGVPWIDATVPGSKGCGANMRVQPVGLLDVDQRARAALAQFQAGLTHDHPTGLAASDLTALAIAELATGTPAAELVPRLRAYAEVQVNEYHQDWLGDLWMRPGESSPAEFIRRGWDECMVVLRQLAAALEKPDRDSDPCSATGEGWIAEEALATGLLCFLLFPDDPVAAVRRAALTRGDSDSIA